MKTLEDCTRDLALQSFPQDWGIFNADEARLPEFVAYARRTFAAPLTYAAERELCDLLL